jgi:hypothetical protein
MEPNDRMAYGLEHPPHLPVAALVQNELDPTTTQAANTCRGGSAVLELDALGQLAQDGVGRLALDVGDVRLLDAVARMREPVRKHAVVGEEQRARGVGVEAADRHDPSLVPHELDDGWTALRIASSGDDSGRLVQEHVGEGLCRDAAAVDLNDVPC